MSTAIGSGAEAVGFQTMAANAGTTAAGLYAFALGHDSWAHDNSSAAFGVSGKALAAWGVPLGVSNTVCVARSHYRLLTTVLLTTDRASLLLHPRYGEKCMAFGEDNECSLSAHDAWVGGYGSYSSSYSGWALGNGAKSECDTAPLARARARARAPPRAGSPKL